MLFDSRLALRRRSILLIFGSIFLVLFAMAVSGAGRAEAYRVLCARDGIGCISGYGYDAESYWNNPVDSRGNNCTNYVAFRLKAEGIENPGRLFDAYHWAFRARKVGVTVDQKPAPGSIARWPRGRFAPEYGHVAFVERVMPGFILLSDSNWYGGSKRWRVSRGDWEWPSNFIHFQE